MDNLKLLYLFVLIGATQGLLISFVILFKKHSNKLLKYLFGLALLILSLRLAFYPFVDIVGEVKFWYHVNLITLLSLLLIGPLLYLYINVKLCSTNVPKFIWLIHLIPIFYYYIHLYVYPVPIPLCYCHVPLVSGIFYGLLALVLLIFSVNSIPYSKKRSLLVISLLLFFIPALVIFVDYAGILENQFRPALIPYILVTVIFYAMGFNLMMRSNQYLTKILKPIVSNYKIDQTKLNRLLELIKTEQLYLDNSFTLHKLSERSGLSRHEVSKLVNVGLNKTFNELINEYRIKLVLKKFKDMTHDHLSIIGIANESGFKSKVTFLKYFKKHTNHTPSEFLKQQNSIKHV